MPQEAKFLSAEQFLIFTLVVKLAVVATLATMLVRFRQFRRILLTEQRAWRERLVFALQPGNPSERRGRLPLAPQLQCRGPVASRSVACGTHRWSVRRGDRR